MLVVLGSGAPILRAGPLRYVVIDLGTLGGPQSFATGINARSEVTGVSETTGDVLTRAFFWNGTMQDIGTLGGSFSQGNGIGNSGLVTGSSNLPVAPPLSITNAFLWNGTAMQALGTLGGVNSF